MRHLAQRGPGTAEGVFSLNFQHFLNLCCYQVLDTHYDKLADKHGKSSRLARIKKSWIRIETKFFKFGIKKDLNHPNRNKNHFIKDSVYKNKKKQTQILKKEKKRTLNKNPVKLSEFLRCNIHFSIFFYLINIASLHFIVDVTVSWHLNFWDWITSLVVCLLLQFYILQQLSVHWDLTSHLVCLQTLPSQLS